MVERGLLEESNACCQVREESVGRREGKGGRESCHEHRGLAVEE